MDATAEMEQRQIMSKLRSVAAGGDLPPDRKYAVETKAPELHSLKEAEQLTLAEGGLKLEYEREMHVGRRQSVQQGIAKLSTISNLIVKPSNVTHVFDGVDSDSLSLSLDKWEWTSNEDKVDDDEYQYEVGSNLHHHHFNHSPHHSYAPQQPVGVEAKKDRSDSANSLDSELDTSIHTPKAQDEGKGDRNGATNREVIVIREGVVGVVESDNDSDSSFGSVSDEEQEDDEKREVKSN